jgi:Dyp-type peroxidase family
MSFDLNRTLSWTNALMAKKSSDAADLAMLSDLQGNILKGHGRDHTMNFFLSFDRAAAAQVRGLLRQLGHEMPSALDQLTGAQVFKATRQDAGLFMAVFLSASGYDKLDAADLMPAGNAFRAGMKRRQATLADPATAGWEPTFAGDVDALILLANDDTMALQQASAALKARIDSLGGAAAVVGIEVGRAQRNKEDGQGIEHFGYVDGRSQPLMLEEDIKNEEANGGIDQWNPTIPLSQVLVPCPGAELEASFGSFFVFRKLEQNVRAFKRHEGALANALQSQSGTNPGELAGAYVVGRFENGTPTAVSPVEVPLHGKPVANDFNFDTDQAGLRCPFAAHIRKTNPRDKTINSNVHLMARRGIPYGERADDPNDGAVDNKPEGGVGLLFMAYQSSIEGQFEFTQQSWVNSPGFHFRAQPQPVGIDPVIGQPDHASPQRYPLHYGVGPLSEPFDFSSFVRMKGGEYFFAPSRSFLQRL